MNDEQLERRMRDWNRAEMAAAQAERAAMQSVADTHAEGIESPVRRAARLRRMADAILASVLEDVRQRKGNAAEAQAS